MSDKKTVAADFTDAERDAMRTRAKELRDEAKQAKNRAAGEADLQAAIEKMPEPDKSFATKIHKIVKENAPELLPKTWYGMPAYATKEGKVVCFFQNASKFGYRYATFGLQEDAHVDEGNMWPIAYAITDLGSTVETKIAELVKKAVS